MVGEGSTGAATLERTSDHSGATTRGWPIAFILTVSVGALLALTFVSLFIAGYLIARSNTAELVREKAEFLIDSVDERVRAQLDPVAVQLDFLRQEIARRQLTLDHADELAPLLLASAAAVPQVSAVAFVAPDLRLLRAFRNRPESRIVLSDWHDDPAFRRLVEEANRHAVLWGELFVAEEADTTFINCSMPVRVGSNILGTLIASVSIFELSDFLRNLKEQTSDNAFILFDRETVLAAVELRPGVANLDDQHPLPALSDLSDPILSRIWTGKRVTDREAAFRDDVEARVIEVGGKHFVFLLRALDGYGAHPWLLGSYHQIDAIAPQLRRLSQLGWIAAAVLAVALAATFLLGRQLSRPIRQLAAEATRIRQLDFARPSGFRRGWFRELNELQSAHAAMLEGLHLFGSYVPRLLISRLMQRRSALTSEQRTVTVLFTDLVGFTALAEDRSATEIAAFLNRHFSASGRCIEAELGTIDKYIGDSVMAFWGAPLEQPDQADRACRAALAIADSITEWNRERTAQGRSAVQMRVGIHTGDVVVGNIGAPQRLNYTVIGDAVNIAQRLEELARDRASYDDETFIVVSEATASRVTADFALSTMGRHAVRGRTEPLPVFRLERALSG